MSKLYGQVFNHAFSKRIDWANDTIKVMLLSSSYTPNQDAHAYLADVEGSQVTGTGYSAGGAVLANATLAYDAGTNVFKLDADDVTFANSTITARYAVVYDDTGASSATKPLVAFFDFTTDQSSVNGNFTITWDATGMARVTVA